ncbi:hypothetical protein H3N34_14480 [Photobacterium damselae subsp. damselae]|uniref:hypothetical protein n=1 Tax=Photobacterium damselae TaxID=38293 RepID=UPI0015F64FE8|nr:hypothetical protein [Photobacterium damselae]MBA5684402.1 hypothetical protein [Photobacterium damselae subsp. damselae]
MKILYFEPHEILYSITYLKTHHDIRKSYKSLMPFTNRDNLIMNVEPDRLGAKKLAEAAIEANLLLYPLSRSYTRDMLVKHRIFLDSQLAPFVDISSLNLRPDDNDLIRYMIFHASSLDADWYVCGDIASEERLKRFPKRYLPTRFGEGVSEELISMIHKL